MFHKVTTVQVCTVSTMSAQNIQMELQRPCAQGNERGILSIGDCLPPTILQFACILPSILVHHSYMPVWGHVVGGGMNAHNFRQTEGH